MTAWTVGKQRGVRSDQAQSQVQAKFFLKKYTVVIGDAEDALGLTAADEHGAPNLDGLKKAQVKSQE